MRAVVVGWCLMAASSFKVCSSEEKGAQGSATAAGSAAVSASLSATAPRIGGQMLVVGEHAVELLVHRSGSVEAVVVDASNQAVTTGVGFAVSVPTKAGASEAIGLSFVPARARFEGNAKAGVELVSGPLEVALTANGKTAKAKLASALALGTPKFGGNLLVADGQAFEVLLKPSGEVLAYPSATLSAAPKFELEANLPVVGGARERVNLRFDAPRKCFSGRARAGSVLAAGPVDLSIVGKAGASVGRLEQVALRAEAAHGGSVLVAGDYSIELAERADLVEAYAFDAQGKALTAADLGVSLEFGGRPETNLALAWEPDFGCYRAKLRDGIELDTTPIQVTVASGGRAFVGATASLRAIAEARLDPPRLRAGSLGAEARVEANLPQRPELRADVQLPNVKAQVDAEARRALGAAAGIRIAPPKVSIQKSASAGAKAGGAKASAGFSFGVK